jgi:acetylornithine deacetylase
MNVQKSAGNRPLPVFFAAGRRNSECSCAVAPPDARISMRAQHWRPAICMAATPDIASREISSAVDSLRGDLFAFLARLVQHPSLPGGEQQAQSLYAAKLAALALETQIVPSSLDELKEHPAFCDDGVPFHDRLNIVGRWRGNGEGEGRTLILNGHMDVVPTGNEALWSESPWSGAVRSGRLYGRGACDMKAGLAANAFAVQALQAIGFSPSADLLLESVIGEESGGAGTLATIVKGFRADAAVITEPTRLRVCPVQSGALTFRLRVRGRAIHACMKPHGVSAIEKFYLVLAAVQELERVRHREYRNSLYEDPNNIAPVNVGVVRAGDWPSTVPDELVAEGRFGVLPGESPAAARSALAECLGAIDDPWLREHRPHLEWFEGQFEAGETAADAPVVTTLSECHQHMLGEPPGLQGVTYGSDLRLFTNHAQIPAVLYGPGDVADAHTVNESVELEEVVSASKSLACMIARWCGGRFPA